MKQTDVGMYRTDEQIGIGTPTNIREDIQTHVGRYVEKVKLKVMETWYMWRNKVKGWTGDRPAGFLSTY